MTDTEILDWLDRHGCPVKWVFGYDRWIHTVGSHPPLYKRTQYDSLREAALAAIEESRRRYGADEDTDRTIRTI